MHVKVKSDFLFAQPSFASGVARLLDLYGTFDDYNISKNTLQADAKAIAADWICVGQDVQEAMDQLEVPEKVAV